MFGPAFSITPAPRRPEPSPRYRVLADHCETRARVHEERFEPSHGPLSAVARQAMGGFLDGGRLERGCARVRCPNCRAACLVAFRCQGRHVCPSCHARRWAERSLWLEEHLLAAVPHRQGMLTIPQRLRGDFLHDRRRRGLRSPVAYRPRRGYVQGALGARAAAPGGDRGRAALRRAGARSSAPAGAPDRRRCCGATGGS